MQETIKETYADFITFLRNPKDQAANQLNRVEQLKKLFSILIIEIPIMGILILLISSLESLGLLDPDNHKILEMIKTTPVILLLVLTVLIGPFFEELIFRMHLRYKNNYAVHFITSLVSLSGVRNKQKVDAYFTALWKKRYKFIFFSSAALFGIVHITNYELSYTILLLSPILVAPQIISGLFIGFLRVRHGFVLGFLMHALHNAFFIGIPLIFMLSTPEKINIKNSIYTIDIEETNNLYGSSSQQNYPDSMAYKSVSLKTTLSYLLDINEIALKTNKKEVLNKTINLNFKNKSKDSSLTKKIVLDQLAKSYNFKIHKRSILTEIWNLRVVNPEILAKYKTTNNYPENIIRISTEKIVIKKSKIKTLVNALIKETNKIILDKIDLKTNYNFTLQIKNFENLKNQLKNEYGLSLIKQKIYVEYIMILFPQQE